VRPLIDIGRGELREYLAALAQPFREDASNADLTIPRNRIRHELLPLLDSRYTPGIAKVLARDAAIARDDEDRLQREAIEVVDSIVLPGSRDAEAPGGTVEIDGPGLARLHPAIASRVARILLERAAPGRFVGFEHVQRLLGLAAAGGAGAVNLPGSRAVRRGDVIELGGRPAEPFQNSFQVSLSIPGEVVVADWVVTARASEGHAGAVQDGLAGATVQGVSLPLTVRSRRPGDRLRPFGMAGRTKKLQDLLVDRKVARERRDRLPLVVDANDRIVWVVGHAVTEDFRVTTPSQAVIILKARRLGGQG
jgi:tRNA(Ile)-lysidine synthase